MNKDRSSNGSASLSWFERFSQALSGGEPKDKAELLALLRDAEERQLLGIDALAMIEGVLQVSEMQVRDIMIPRTQMVMVEQNSTLNEILPVITESGHSRFPVSGDGREVVGLILAKDLLPYFADEDNARFNVNEVLRPVVYVPESKRLNVLLKEFRTNRNHMAIVVDEFGSPAGLVTIEDVVEQIVGEIEDEHDIEEDLSIKKLKEGHFVIKALTTIEDFNDYFSSRFSDDEFDTVGGLVMKSFGRMPSRGDVTSIEGYAFKTLSADSRRIYLLEVSKIPEQVASLSSDTNSESSKLN